MYLPTSIYNHTMPKGVTTLPDSNCPQDFNNNLNKLYAQIIA